MLIDGVVKCPSGLSGRVKKLQLEEFEILGDRAAVQNGEAYEHVLSSCWTETLETGPAYKLFSWTDALQGDRFVALIAIRQRTHGDEFEFDVQCQNPACRRKFGWKIKLSELKVKEYPADSIRKHVANEAFTYTLAGRRVAFKLMTGKMERALERALRGDKKLILGSLTYRLITVEGLKHPSGEPAEDDKKEIRNWLGKVDMDEITTFRQHMDAVGGGVDTTLEVQCTFRDCEHLQEVELPFGGADFWTPKKRGTGEPPDKQKPAKS